MTHLGIVTRKYRNGKIVCGFGVFVEDADHNAKIIDPLRAIFMEVSEMESFLMDFVPIIIKEMNYYREHLQIINKNKKSAITEAIIEEVKKSLAAYFKENKNGKHWKCFFAKYIHNKYFRP